MEQKPDAAGIEEINVVHDDLDVDVMSYFSRCPPGLSVKNKPSEKRSDDPVIESVHTID